MLSMFSVKNIKEKIININGSLHWMNHGATDNLNKELWYIFKVIQCDKETEWILKALIYQGFSSLVFNMGEIYEYLSNFKIPDLKNKSNKYYFI